MHAILKVSVRDLARLLKGLRRRFLKESSLTLVCLHAISHCPVAALSLFPHARQLRMVQFDVVVNQYFDLVRMLAMQAAGMVCSACSQGR